MILSAGCGTSSNLQIQSERPDLPPLPDRIVQGCPDIPITGDAITDLVKHRQGYAGCKSLQREGVDFYLDLMSGIEGAKS